jgi:hypothetical protein
LIYINVIFTLVPRVGPIAPEGKHSPPKRNQTCAHSP